MRSNKRPEKRPPKIWDLPFDIRRQLSGRGGRQRAIAADNHLMLVLNRVPQPNSDQADTVYFWRNRDQKWHFSDRGGGFGALETVVQQYEDRIVELEEALAAAKDSRARFLSTGRDNPDVSISQKSNRRIAQSLGTHRTTSPYWRWGIEPNQTQRER